MGLGSLTGRSFAVQAPPISPDALVSRYIDKNRTGACGLGRNRRLLRHTELVFFSVRAKSSFGFVYKHGCCELSG